MEDSSHPTENGFARIVVADDHPVYREALRTIFKGQPDLEVVAEAAGWAQALELCRRFCPDLVLMDMRMPKVDGLAATRAMCRLPQVIRTICPGGVRSLTDHLGPNIPLSGVRVYSDT